MKKYLIVTFLFLYNLLLSQNCPFIGPDISLPCGQLSTTLTADLSQCGPGNGPLATTNYQNTQIPYVAQTNTGNQITMTDDSQQGPFPIGFTFCFYGNTYNQFWIGSNGWISFSPGQPTTYTSATIPSAANPVNSVMGVWQDWHPGLGGQIRYQVQGTAPCRKLVVSWINVPMFSCTNLTGTFHIVLYESTNVIEVHIQNKPNCTQWAGGTAVQGIQNSNGTQAVTTPGRNSTQWIAQNDGRRWTPSGAPVVATPTWYQVGNPAPIGTGLTITVTPPPAGAYYTCHLVYPSCFAGWSNCNQQPGLVPDTIFVEPGITLLPPLTQFINPTCSGDCDGSINVIPQTGTPPFTINWSNGGSGTTLTGLCSGSYTATLVDALGCLVTSSPIILTDPTPPITNTILGPDTICIGSNSEIFSTTSVLNYTYNWISDGQVVSGQNSNQVDIDFSQNSGQVQTSVQSFSVDGCPGNIVQFITTILDIQPEITQIGPFCFYDECQLLTANPIGGQFFGPGVEGGEFCPQQSTSILNQITYTYTQSGCAFNTTSNIVVNPIPNILEIIPDNAFIQICDEIDSALLTLSLVSDIQPTTNFWILNSDTIENVTLTGNFPEGVTDISAYVISQGCISEIESTTVNVSRCPEVIYYIPNSFTPDGDEFNNEFGVVFTAGFSPYEFHLEIWNRWGEIIWESFDHNAKWDGTYDSKTCQAGIYTWKIRWGNEDNDGFNIITGHINLIR